MARIVYRATISAPGGTRRVSNVEHVDAGNRFEERMSSFSVARQVPEPREGVASKSTGSLAIVNDDGSFNGWLVTPAEDPRGSLAVLEEYDLDSGTSAELLRGVVSEAPVASSSDGHVVVSLRVTDEPDDQAATVIPRVVHKAGDFSIPYTEDASDPDNETVVEALGMVYPVVFGGTREHVPAVYVRQAPAANGGAGLFEWIACHDATDARCRAWVNSVYTADEFGLMVISRSQYQVSRSAYSGYVTVQSTTPLVAGAAPLWCDLEATEANSLQAGVRRHWTFRESLVSEVALVGGFSRKTLLPVLAGATAQADYEFAASGTWLDDTSGNSRTLVASGNTVPANVLVAEEDGDQAVNNQFLADQVTRFASYFRLASGSDATLNFAGTQEFHVYARVCRNSGGLYNVETIHGPAVGKINSYGWALDFEHGVAVARLVGKVAGAYTARFAIGKTHLEDGHFHEVVMSVNRATVDENGLTDRLKLIVDGAVEADVAIGSTFVQGSTASGGDDASPVVFGVACGGYVGGTTPLKFTGQIGRVSVFDFPYRAQTTWGKGQSGQSKSAVKLGVGMTALAEKNGTLGTAVDFGATTDLSLMLWLKWDTGDTLAAHQVLKKRSGAGAGTGVGFALTINANGTLTLAMQGASGSGSASTTTDFSDGTWHQLWATYSIAAAQIKLYVDGRLETTVSATLGSVSNTQDLRVEFKGWTDEIVFEINSGATIPAAQVRQQHAHAVGNPARLFRWIVENTTWGLGGSVVSADTDAAEDELRTRRIFYGGALYEERDAEAYFVRILAPLGAYHRRLGAAWSLGFAYKGSGTTYAFGKGPASARNVVELSIGRRPIRDLPKSVSCRYHRINAPEAPDRRFLTRTVPRTVSTKGREERIIDLDYVRTWDTADRIAHFQAEWEKAELLGALTADLENRALQPGDAMTIVHSALGLTGTPTFRASVVQRVGQRLQLSYFEDAPAALVYVAGTAVPDFLPDAAPDLRTTDPTSPFDLYLADNFAGTFYSRFLVRWTMANDEIAKLLVTGARVGWRYDDEDETAWRNVDVAALAGQTLQFGALADPGRNVLLYVVAVGRNGRTSGKAPYVAQGVTSGVTSNAGESVLKFAVAIGANPAVDQPQSQAGFHARLNALETGSGAGTVGAPRVAVLSGAGFNGSAVTFVDQLPEAVNLTYQVVILLSNEALTRSATDPPAAGQFYLSGTGNRTVKYYRPPHGTEIPTGPEVAIAFYTPA